MTEKDAIRMEQLGARLWFIRNEGGYSLRDVNFKTGIDDSKISKIEKGKIEMTVATFFDILAGMRIHPRDFFDYTVDWATKGRTDLGQREEQDVSKEIIEKMMDKIPVPRKFHSSLVAVTEKIRAVEGEVVLKTRTGSNDLFYVADGILEIIRKYRKQGEPRGFLIEGDIYIGGVTSADTPCSFNSLRACKNAVVYRIPGAAIEDLCKRSADFMTFVASKVARINQMGFKYRSAHKLTAEERMAWLETNFPEWVDAIPRAKLADYLTIAPDMITKYKSGMPKVSEQ